MKCHKIGCKLNAIIRFDYETHKEPFCLDHLVERLRYIRDNEFFHILSDIKHIIPIY